MDANQNQVTGAGNLVWEPENTTVAGSDNNIQQESDNFYCGAFCNPLAPSTETQRILGTNDILDASGNFTLNNSNRTITCQDASGNGFIQTSTDSNNLSAFGGWNYTEGGGRNVPLSGGTYEVCDIDLGASGKIAGGWTHTSSIAPVPGVGPIQFDTITSFDTKTMLVTSACTAPLDLAEGFAVTNAYLAGGRDVANITAYLAANPLSNNCLVSSWQYLAYLTCDIDYECGQFGKSVPVPAFAAGVLGLGLFGITYLTSRRRSVR